MTRVRLFALSACVVCMAFVTAAAMAQDASQIVAGACSKCHPAKKLCPGFGVKDKAAWEKTLNTMVAKGAAVAEKDKPAVVDWLASQQAGAKPICE